MSTPASAPGPRSPDEPNPPAPLETPRRPGLLRMVYNHNPFYLLSVCFVLHGTRFWLHDGTRLNASWQFMAVICGFILLLDLTAFVIVRWGKVWDDARTILLTLLFLFVTLALTFDQTLLANPVLGQALLIGGFLFCSLVTEGLLLGLGIRLPALFRVPYYLQLGMLFLYPVGLQPDATTDAASLSWRIWLFSPLASGALLSLVPAIRRGREYVARNGTPWVWPLFPWCVFLFLGLGLGYRAYALSLSFDPVTSLDFDAARNLETAFGAWHLVPMVLAAGVLLLEIGRVEALPVVQRIALAFPVLALTMAFPSVGRSVPHDEFLSAFRGVLGAPALSTLVLATAFYAWAFLKRVRYAQECLATAMLSFGFIGIDTLGVRSFTPVQGWPLAAAAIFQLAMGLRDRRSPRVAFGLICGAAAVRFEFLSDLPADVGNGAWFAMAEFALVGVAWHYQDRFARAMRPLTAWILMGGALRLLGRPDVLRPWLPPWMAPAIVAATAVVASGIASVWLSRPMRSLAWYVLGWFQGAMGVAGGSLAGYVLLSRYRGSLDVDSLLLGGACFVTALAISTAKGGMLQKLASRIPRPPEPTPFDAPHATS